MFQLQEMNRSDFLAFQRYMDRHQNRKGHYKRLKGIKLHCKYNKLKVCTTSLVKRTLTGHFKSSLAFIAANYARGNKFNRNERDKDDVIAKVNHLNQNLTDPYDVKPTFNLTNIFSGMHARREIQDSFVNMSIHLITFFNSQCLYI